MRSLLKLAALAAFLAFTTLLVLCSSVTLAKNKQPKTYPERGTVLAVRMADKSYQIVGARPQTIYWRDPVYRVETETRIYEFEGSRKSKMALGDVIRFRLKKQSAYVQEGKKERKYRVVGEELKPPK